MKTYIHNVLLKVSENNVIAASRTLSVTEITETVSQVQTHLRLAYIIGVYHSQIRTYKAIYYVFFLSQLDPRPGADRADVAPHARTSHRGSREIVKKHLSRAVTST